MILPDHLTVSGRGRRAIRPRSAGHYYGKGTQSFRTWCNENDLWVNPPTGRTRSLWPLGSCLPCTATGQSDSCARLYRINRNAVRSATVATCRCPGTGASRNRLGAPLKG